jgi:hypothetical protein
MEAQIESMRGNLMALKNKPAKEKKKEKKEKAPVATACHRSTSSFTWTHHRPEQCPHITTSPYAVRPCHFSDFTSTPYPRPRDSTGAHPNGTTSPKNKSWKDIVEHWLVGDPDRGLNTPLKDWPKEWYQGANRWFASKYYWRATMALEFVNQ